MNEKIREALEALVRLGWTVKGINIETLWGSGPYETRDAELTIRVTVPGKPEAK